VHPLEDLVRVVLDPAGPGGVLAVFELVARDDACAAIEQDAATAGRALVDRRDEGSWAGIAQKR
jgi:hypothetical protein